MYVCGKKGEQWSLDEGLRVTARRLIDENREILSHVDLDQVVFIRMSGGTKLKWLGKCYFIGSVPLTIIPKYVIMKLQEFGLLDLSNVSSIDLDIFDIRFVIVLNEDLISYMGGDTQKLEEVTLMHELMHIHPDGEKLVRHDIEDFKDLVDKYGPRWTEGLFKDSSMDFLKVEET